MAPESIPLKARRTCGVLTVFERIGACYPLARYCVGRNPGDLLRDFTKYSKAVRWAKESQSGALSNFPPRN